MRNPIWLFVPVVLAAASTAPAQQTFEPTWESLNKHAAAPEWFLDAKFGIYFHWGV